MYFFGLLKHVGWRQASLIKLQCQLSCMYTLNGHLKSLRPLKFSEDSTQTTYISKINHLSLQQLNFQSTEMAHLAILAFLAFSNFSIILMLK